MKRTHSCSELTEKHTGKTVTLQGWVSKRRDHGNLIFIDLRDRHGTTQIVFSPEQDKQAHKKAQELGKEFVIEIEGTVQKRPKGTENKEISTGNIEVKAKELEILNKCLSPLPVEVDEYIKTSEEQRLKHRYIDLRRTEMQQGLELRHRIVKAIRDYFDSQGFIEIETPVLTKSTPEGARDYLVPSRIHKGKFFALPQSPQLFKQLLMVAGMDKYMQIVKCYRDEDLRADRQPEFTQVDIEMSFVEEKDIMETIEKMFEYVFEKSMKQKIKTPFPAISYEKAMNDYGTDKPDTRFEMKLSDLTHELEGTEFNVFSTAIQEKGSIKAITAKNCASYSRKELDELTEIAKKSGARGLVAIKITTTGTESQITKFLKQKHTEAIKKKTGAGAGDLVLIVAGEWKTACTALGELRNQLGKKLGLIDEEKNAFLWITGFPLMEYSAEEQKLVAVHHPFTSPQEKDLALLEKSPEKAKARAYDIVWNGHEVGGGSIRIHNPEIQEKVFRCLGIGKKEAEQKFGFLLEAFKYGAPPHGGIALGLDRIVALAAKKDNIREVIAFPKNKACISPMDNAPNDVSEQQLKELHIKIMEEK